MRQGYYRVPQLILLQSAASLLQSAAVVITKCDRNNYKVRQLLQSAVVIALCGSTLPSPFHSGLIVSDCIVSFPWLPREENNSFGYATSIFTTLRNRKWRMKTFHSWRGHGTAMSLICASNCKFKFIVRPPIIM